MVIIFNMLVSLFERAYLLLHEGRMPDKQLRRWRSREDCMRKWCRRSNFRMRLPLLLSGEDPALLACIEQLASSEAVTTSTSR